MKDPNFTIAFSVTQTPAEAFNAIQNVRGWWGQGVEGSTEKINDEFVYRYEKLHRTTQKLTEAMPGSKLVWRVIDAELTFTKNKAEWKDTELVFEIAPKGAETEVRFTHRGLVPERECFKDCASGWTFYIGSLKRLIATGTGEPDPAERARG